MAALQVQTCGGQDPSQGPGERNIATSSANQLRTARIGHWHRDGNAGTHQKRTHPLASPTEGPHINHDSNSSMPRTPGQAAGVCCVGWRTPHVERDFTSGRLQLDSHCVAQCRSRDSFAVE